MRVQVLANGRVSKFQVARSSDFGRLDEAAMRAPKDWLFIPARVEGQSVDAIALVPVAFRLERD